ncbi:hypothetical protein B0J13DRAFT_617226 [Dactylonectria estremocensis]|uniref:Uncharacterized protein n=1 Tax=Dactylonectria estremocensis TaxID=1079267 RepID=A0A9P9JCL9_9HYPO|nr:hypothetical protein B0J13DRAFT_617226 [Dactylonectria estremocensis]
MTLTPESIIGICGVVTTVPPTILLCWKLWLRRKSSSSKTSDSLATSQAESMPPSNEQYSIPPILRVSTLDIVYLRYA